MVGPSGANQTNGVEPEVGDFIRMARRITRPAAGITASRTLSEVPAISMEEMAEVGAGRAPTAASAAELRQDTAEEEEEVGVGVVVAGDNWFTEQAEVADPFLRPRGRVS